MLFRDGLLEVLAPPLNLLVVELFRTPAKSVALKAGQLQLKPFISANAARKISCNVGGSSGRVAGAVNMDDRLNRHRKSQQMKFP